MSRHHRATGNSTGQHSDLFAIHEAQGVTHVPPDQVTAYVSALEERCNTLWGYIQGYTCSSDPVVRFLASELGITVAHAPDTDSGPAAD